MTLFAVRHVLGVNFDGHTLVLKPAPYPGSGPLKADLRYRTSRLNLEIPVPVLTNTPRSTEGSSGRRRMAPSTCPPILPAAALCFKETRRIPPMINGGGRQFDSPARRKAPELNFPPGRPFIQIKL